MFTMQLKSTVNYVHKNLDILICFCLQTKTILQNCLIFLRLLNGSHAIIEACSSLPEDYSKSFNTSKTPTCFLESSNE